MGWNSYDYYDTAVTEADVRRNAEVMHDRLRRFGYEYVVTDISWYVKHAAAPAPVSPKRRFAKKIRRRGIPPAGLLTCRRICIMVL